MVSLNSSIQPSYLSFLASFDARNSDYDGGMAVHDFSSEFIEEFYNAFHGKDGRFTFRKGGKRGKIYVPMSDAARKSNAVLRSMASARKSKEYKTAVQRIKGTWADREKGQGGLRHVKGANSKKADAARATNAVQGGKTKRMNTAQTKAASESAARAKEQIRMLEKMSAAKKNG